MKRGAYAVGPRVCSSHTVTASLPGKVDCESKKQTIRARAMLMASGSSGEGGGPSSENPAGNSDDELRRTITSLVREALASERQDGETDGEGTANPSAGMSLATSPSSLG